MQYFISKHTREYLFSEVTIPIKLSGTFLWHIYTIHGRVAVLPPTLRQSHMFHRDKIYIGARNVVTDSAKVIHLALLLVMLFTGIWLSELLVFRTVYSTVCYIAVNFLNNPHKMHSIAPPPCNTLYAYTIRCRYNAVKLLKFPHNKHRTVRHRGPGYGAFVVSLICNSYSASLRRCVEYHAILNHGIAAYIYIYIYIYIDIDIDINIVQCLWF